MFNILKDEDLNKNYSLMVETVKHIIADERDIIANLANTSAIINEYMERINWVGFYIFKEGELVLGPFQGLPACIRIKSGRGVCGTALIKKETLIVNDVNEFPGHIACDSASKSEIVLPLLKDGKVFGVLDIDSPEYSRFSDTEKIYLEQICSLLEEKL